MSAKRITRKQMKGDEFVTGVSRSMEFIEAHRQYFLIGIGAIVVLILAFAGIRHLKRSRHQEASADLAKVMAVRNAAIQGEGAAPVGGSAVYASVSERNQAFLAEIDRFLETHGDASTVRQANYYKGIAALEEGNYAVAESSLREASKGPSSNIVVSLAGMVLGQSLAEQGKVDDAVAQYRKIAEDRTTAVKEEALMALAEVCEKNGRTEDAVAAYQQVINELPDSSSRFEAQTKIDELTSKGSETAGSSPASAQSTP